MKLHTSSQLQTVSHFTQAVSALILLASASTSFAGPVKNSSGASTKLSTSSTASSAQRNENLYQLFHQPRFNVTDGLDDYAEKLPTAKPVAASEQVASDNPVPAAASPALSFAGSKQPEPWRDRFRQPHLNTLDGLDDYADDFRWEEAPSPAFAAR